MELTDHLATYLGPGEPDDGLWRFEGPEFVSFASAERFGQVLVCSVRPGQDVAARFLVSAALDLVEKGGRGFGNLQIIRNNQPLLARTAITGLLAAGHPYLPLEFNSVDGVEIRTLIPLTDPEIFLADAYGADVLTGLFEQEGPDLLDVTRGPVFDRRSESAED